MDRRGFLSIGLGAFLTFNEANAGLGLVEFPSCKREFPPVSAAFRGESGLIIFFNFDLNDKNRHQYGYNAPYFFSGQYDVNMATHGFKIESRGFSSHTSPKQGLEFDGSFTVDDSDMFDLEGKISADRKSQKLDLLCVEPGASPARDEFYRLKPEDYSRQSMTPLSEDEIATLNQRICSGEIKVFNDVHPDDRRSHKASPCVIVPAV